MHHSSNFYILLQYHLYLNDIIQQHIYIYIYDFFSLSLSLSLSLQSDCKHHRCRIIVVVNASVGGVGHHCPFSHSPSSIIFLIFQHHLLDLNCYDGRHGWGGSSMLELLGFILGFDGNNFGGYCGWDNQCQCGLLLGQRRIWFWIFGVVVGLAVR